LSTKVIQIKSDKYITSMHLLKKQPNTLKHYEQKEDGPKTFVLK